MSKFVLKQTGEIQKSIDAAHKSASRTGALYQAAAVHVIMHSLLSKNHNESAGLANNLYGGMPDSVRNDAMLRFLEQHGNFAYNKAEAKIEWFKNGTLPAAITPAYAAGLPDWTSAKRKPEPKSVYDVAEDLKRLLGTVEKMQKKGVKIEHDALVPQLRAAYARCIAEDYEQSNADSIGQPPAAANLKVA